MTDINTHYDIIVVGNGLVGSAQVCALQHAGLRVALLEKAAVAATSNTDWRPLSLNQASVKILQTLGVSTLVDEESVPIQNVLVTQQGRLGQIRFNAQQLSVPQLGAVVSFDRLSMALYQQAVTQAEVLQIDAVQCIDQSTDKVTLTCRQGGSDVTISADVLVAADGAGSVCRQLLSVPVTQQHSDEVSMAFCLTLSAPHQQRAWQRFTQQGTLAILPMREANQVRLVWTCSAALAQDVVGWQPEQWVQHVNSVYRGYCPAVVSARLLQQFPLRISQASRQHVGRCLLMGNAARTFYPTTAQGFNLALRDVAALAQLLVQAKQNQRAIDATLIAEFVAWRQPDQTRVMQITAAMNTVFGLQLPGWSVLRGLGLSAVELVPFLKPRLAQRLLGYSGRVPDLALGVPLAEQESAHAR